MSCHPGTGMYRVAAITFAVPEGVTSERIQAVIAELLTPSGFTDLWVTRGLSTVTIEVRCAGDGTCIKVREWRLCAKATL